ncbi:hypothetical protein IC575_006665 [Cucumis melo]
MVIIFNFKKKLLLLLLLCLSPKVLLFPFVFVGLLNPQSPISDFDPTLSLSLSLSLTFLPPSKSLLI